MINWIVSSTVLIAIVIVLRQLLRGKINPRLQYALWGLVLLRLLIPVNFGESAISLVNQTEKIPVVQTAESVRHVNEIALLPDGSVAGYTPADTRHEMPTVVTPYTTPTEFDRMEQVLSVRQLLLTLWLTGSALLLLIFLVSNLRFAAHLRRSRSPLRRNDTSLPVYVSSAADTPCLFGLLRPAIYVTPEVAACETVMRHAIAHETTHFRQGDHIWSILRGLCLALHWYHPLVWLAAVLSKRDGELSCDEGTVKRLGEEERASYGRTLLHLTCEKQGSLLTAATTMSGSGQRIKERITLLVKRPKTAVYTLVALLLAMALATGCTFTGPKNTSTGEETFPIRVEQAVKAPPEVIDAAKHYVQMQIDSFHRGWAEIAPEHRISDARVVGLTPMETDTGDADCTLTLYRLEYRLKVSGDPVAILSGGLMEENGWITEQTSTGRPYLLFRTNDTGTIFVADTRDEIMGEAFGTPAFLNAHGYQNVYEAAARELYAAYKQEHPMEGAAVYSVDGMSYAIPAAFADKLLLREHDGDILFSLDVLFSLYEKASQELAAADGVDYADSVGHLVSIARYDRAGLEEIMRTDLPGISFFAKDDAGNYYAAIMPTDVSMYRSQDIWTAEDRDIWSQLAVIPELIRTDFITRNGLTPYSTDALLQSFTYPGEHRWYEAVFPDGNVSTLVLSQPAEQGERGIWCVERAIRSFPGGSYTTLCFPESGMPAADYYAKVQQEHTRGKRTDHATPEAAITAYAREPHCFDFSAAQLRELPPLPTLQAFLSSLDTSAFHAEPLAHGDPATLSLLLSKAAAHEIRKEPPHDFLCWNIFCTFEQAEIDTMTLSCGAAENSVRVTMEKGVQKQILWLQDKALYDLIRQSGDLPERMDQDACQTHRNAIRAEINRYLAERPGRFDRCDLVGFYPAAIFDVDSGHATDTLYRMDFALHPAEGCYPNAPSPHVFYDSQMRLRSRTAQTYLAVRTRDGKVTATVSMQGIELPRPEDAHTPISSVSDALDQAELPVTVRHHSLSDSSVKNVYLADTPYNSSLSFTAQKQVENFRLFEVSADLNSSQIIPGKVLYQTAAVGANASLGVALPLPELLPTHGISYTENGKTYRFTINESGRDGSVLLLPF